MFICFAYKIQVRLLIVRFSLITLKDALLCPNIHSKTGKNTTSWSSQFRDILTYNNILETLECRSLEACIWT